MMQVGFMTADSLSAVGVAGCQGLGSVRENKELKSTKMAYFNVLYKPENAFLCVLYPSTMLS